MLIALDKREASTCLRLVILQESFFGTDFTDDTEGGDAKGGGRRAAGR